MGGALCLVGPGRGVYLAGEGKGGVSSGRRSVSGGGMGTVTSGGGGRCIKGRGEGGDWYI